METGTPMRGYCYDGWLGFVRAVYKVHALIEGVEKYSNEQSNIYIDELMGDKGERDLLKGMLLARCCNAVGERFTIS